MKEITPKSQTHINHVVAEGNECDQFAVPEGFWPTTIAIHLGKRIG